MKKIRMYVAVICMVIVLVLVFLGNINNILLYQMVNKLESTVSKQTQILDKAYVYGKLNGNGNGVQYFGAVLVADTLEEEITRIVEDLSDQYEEVGYKKQNGNQIQLKCLEHRTLCFSDSSVSDNKQYYIVYFFNSQHPLSWRLDLAGR